MNAKILISLLIVALVLAAANYLRRRARRENVMPPGKARLSLPLPQ